MVSFGLLQSTLSLIITPSSLKHKVTFKITFIWSPIRRLLYNDPQTTLMLFNTKQTSERGYDEDKIN